MSSSFFLLYLLDKYLLRARIYIRWIFVM